MPDSAVTPEAINSALDSVTRVNEHMLIQGLVPLAAEAIAQGVQWSAEPPGEESFDNAQEVWRRGWGDCDDLAPYHAASLRVTGVDPGAAAKVIRTGPNTWHALVQRSNGDVDDPSAWAGMPMPHGALAPISRPINGGRVGVVAAHRIGAWYARADLPWRGTPWAVSGVAAACSPEDAIEQAIAGVCVVGVVNGIADPADCHALYEGMRRRGWQG